MTFDDDFIKLLLDKDSDIMLNCKANGLEFPPPPQINISGVLFDRVRYSQITDDQRKDMTRVVRGAEYKVAE